jgi:hypothetical protein
MRLDPHFGMLPLGAFKHYGDRRIRLHGGGGGIPVLDDMADTAVDTFNAFTDSVDNARDFVATGGSDLFDFVDSAVNTVGDVVSDTGKAVGDTLDKVATAIDNTVTAALDDPIKTAAIATAMATQQYYLIPYIQGASALANGASPEEALKQAAIAYAAGEVGQGVSAETGSNIAGGSAAGASNAALRGGDIEQGAISGGLSGAIKSGAQNISDQNLQDWSQQQAANAYDNAPSPTEQDVLAADPSIKMDFPLTTPTDATGPGYYDETTGEYIKSDIGGLQGPLDNTSGTITLDGYNYDPATKTWTTPDGETYNMDYLQNSGQAVSGSDILEPPSDGTPGSYDPALTRKEIEQGLNFVKNAVLAGDQQTKRLAGIKARAGQVCAAMGGYDMNVPWLSTKEQMLRNKLPDESGIGIKASPSDLDNIYKSITPELGRELADRGIGANIFRQETPKITGLGEVTGFAAGSSVDATGASGSSGFCSTWGAMGQFMPKFYPTSGGMLQAGGKKQGPTLNPLKQMQSHIASSGNIGGMARGGLPAKYQEAAPEGHNPEFVTGLTGYYACGGGTGQSDDIPAMLHDGDYVMDADVVAALGDGSSKAGKQVLEGFLHQVPHKDTAGGKPVPAKIADGEYVFPAGFVTALGGGDNKAGAKILDGMREKLRAHKRSAPTSKIPPKAKSPLDYIKGMKG